MNQFKKVFNESKLNAPKNEQQQQQSLNEEKSSKSKKKSSNNNKQNNSPPPSPKKIDYHKYEALMGAPRVSDHIAFQLLEISSNFTPEVSEYKTGHVVEFDSNTNEITIKMDSKFDSILEKPSKFTVVMSETEAEEEKEVKEAEKDFVQKELSGDENLVRFFKLKYIQTFFQELKQFFKFSSRLIGEI